MPPPFHGVLDDPTERPPVVTFRQQLNRHHEPVGSGDVLTCHSHETYASNARHTTEVLFTDSSLYRRCENNVDTFLVLIKVDRFCLEDLIF